jgi:hypothetical protein
MSLKAFHLIFITAAIMLAFGFGGWLFKGFFSPGGRIGDLVGGGAAVAVGIGLIFYERYFLNKTRKMSYL